jgi:hypothetical protein
MKTGVYFLLRNRKVVYIGKTTRWPRRSTEHAHIDFDQCRIIECDRSQIAYYERRLIQVLRPKHNTMHSKPIIKNRVTDEWIKLNKRFIKKSFESDKMGPLTKKAMEELGYARGSVSCFTILRAYKRIYKVDFEWSKLEFKRIKA